MLSEINTFLRKNRRKNMTIGEKILYEDKNIGNPPAETIAQITAVYKDLFEIESDKGKGLGRVKRSRYDDQQELYPTAGDYVAVDWQGADHSIILRTLPRTSVLSRLDSFKEKNN